MKKILLVLVTLFLWGCNESIEEVPSTNVMQVKVELTSEASFQDYEAYIGHIKGSGFLKHAFQSDGQLIELYVSKGEAVKKGDLLGRLDTEGLDFAQEVAAADLAAAQAQYNKALNAFNYARDVLDDTTALFNQGVASQSTFDQVALNYQVASSDLSAASEQVKRAETNLDVQDYQLEKSTIFAEKDGVVVETMYEVGEMVPKGYPIVVLRDVLPVVSVGITQKDLAYATIDKPVEVIVDESTFNGQVISISEIPDEVTQTYEVEIAIEATQPIGTVVKVNWTTGFVEGTKLPLSAIRSDGIDYVFIVRNGHAERVEVMIVDIMNQEVIVTGLEDQSQLILEGIMGLSEGQAVTIVEE